MGRRWLPGIAAAVTPFGERSGARREAKPMIGPRLRDVRDGLQGHKAHMPHFLSEVRLAGLRGIDGLRGVRIPGVRACRRQWQREIDRVARRGVRLQGAGRRSQGVRSLGAVSRLPPPGRAAAG